MIPSDYIKDKPGGTGPALEVGSALCLWLNLKDLFAVDRIYRHFCILAVIDTDLVVTESVVWHSIFPSHR